MLLFCYCLELVYIFLLQPVICMNFLWNLNESWISTSLSASWNCSVSHCSFACLILLCISVYILLYLVMLYSIFAICLSFILLRISYLSSKVSWLRIYSIPPPFQLILIQYRLPDTRLLCLLFVQYWCWMVWLPTA